MPTVNERCKILRSLNRVYVFEIVLFLVPRLKILRRRGLSYFGIFGKQEAQSSSQETNHNSFLSIANIRFFFINHSIVGDYQEVCHDLRNVRPEFITGCHYGIFSKCTMPTASV